MITEVKKSNEKLHTWQAYLSLCKPKVVGLMLLTALVGMLLASPNTPPPMRIIFFGLLGIGLVASAAATFNHLADWRIDAIMSRTQNRPIPSGRISATKALIFAISLTVVGLTLLIYFVNGLTAILTLLTSVGYAGIYTLYLKRATSQNIVIGGLSGATPPLLGWTAVTGYFDPHSLLLVLIIFVWTPPHFWALAIYRYKDYAKANIPMLPVTHGIEFTKLNIILYSVLLLVVSLLPFATGMSGIIYLISAIILGVIFNYYAFALKFSNDLLIAIKSFRFSIYYLLLLFLALLIDHYLK